VLAVSDSAIGSGIPSHQFTPFLQLATVIYLGYSWYLPLTRSKVPSRGAVSIGIHSIIIPSGGAVYFVLEVFWPRSNNPFPTVFPNYGVFASLTAFF
jgi:hypothetical protein